MTITGQGRNPPVCDFSSPCSSLVKDNVVLRKQSLLCLVSLSVIFNQRCRLEESAHVELVGLFCFLFGVMVLWLSTLVLSEELQCAHQTWTSEAYLQACRQVIWGSEKPQNRSREIKCCQGRG